jgi:hypothetical protein
VREIREAAAHTNRDFQESHGELIASAARRPECSVALGKAGQIGREIASPTSMTIFGNII